MAKGMKIKIGLPTIVFFCGLAVTKAGVSAALPFFAALLHELGHITVMRMCGQQVSEIKILPFGVDIKKTPGLSSYRTDIAVSAAGVVTNGFLLVLCRLLPPSPETALFETANLLLIVINLLPIKTLDGGQLLEKAIAMRFGPEKADRVIGICSFICILLMGSGAIWLLFYTSYNFTLLLMCIYLFLGIFLK